MGERAGYGLAPQGPTRHLGPMTQATPPLRATIIPVTPLQQNCTLLWCTATMRGALVDPGGDIDRLKAAAADTGESDALADVTD